MGGGGEIARYFGGGDCVGDGAGDGANKDFGEHVGEHAGEDRGEHGSDVGGDTLFSSGIVAGDGIWGDMGGGGEDLHEDRLVCTCFEHFSRRCWCNRFFDENTISQCLHLGLLHMFSCACCIRRVTEENEALQSLQW